MENTVIASKLRGGGGRFTSARDKGFWHSILSNIIWRGNFLKSFSIAGAIRKAIRRYEDNRTCHNELGCLLLQKTCFRTKWLQVTGSHNKEILNSHYSCETQQFSFQNDMSIVNRSTFQLFNSSTWRISKSDLRHL